MLRDSIRCGRAEAPAQLVAPVAVAAKRWQFRAPAERARARMGNDEGENEGKGKGHRWLSNVFSCVLVGELIRRVDGRKSFKIIKSAVWPRLCHNRI